MSGSRPSCQPENTFQPLRFSVKLLHPLSTVFAILIVITFLSTSAMAATVHLAWDPNDPAPDGYMILIRVEGDAYNYNAPAWIGATSDCQLEGLVPGTTYYMVVRAYVGELQSGDSNEVTYTPPAEANLESSAPLVKHNVTDGAGTTTSGEAPNVSPDLQRINTLQIVPGE